MSTEMREIVAGILERAGLPPQAVVLADAAPDATPPPEGPWAVVRTREQWVVGGMGRGRFAPYEGLRKASEAVGLAVSLASTPLPVRAGNPTAEELEQGRDTRAAILERAAARGGSAGPTALEPGDVLDVIGPETGHHLYALGTPVPARSQPPSDVGAPYFTFRVAQTFPPSVQEGRAAPWFEQPGGGAMVVLDRPIRWYVDRGYLELVGCRRGTERGALEVEEGEY